MRRMNTVGTAVSVALAAALIVPLVASTASAEDKEILRLRAFAIDMNNGSRAGTIDIVIERWSTPEEAADLRATLIERGDEKLLDALQKIKPRCGFARTSSSLGWDIYFARETGADLEAMNPYGSPLIYGHPQGPTGLRVMIELIEALAVKGGGVGLFTGCAAGDTAMAVVIKVH